MTQNKTYLGDAVYADLNEWGAVKLTTEDVVKESNVIYLEPEVLAALLVWLKKVGLIKQSGL